MNTTIIDGYGVERTIYGARRYLPSRSRADILDDKCLQSSLIAVIQIEDSTEVWEVADLDTVKELINWLADTDHQITSYSIAELLPVFRPM